MSSADDGNEDDADACTVDCELGPMGSANLRETCGNGALDVGEECDDGGHREGDGCGETCQRESSVCGNARLDWGETCDDGNEEPDDGCSATCQIEGAPPPPPPEGCSCRAGSRHPARAWWLAAIFGLIGVRTACRRRRGPEQ